METETTLKIKFDNGEEVEVLKNICEFTDFFLAAACVTGGSGEPSGNEYERIREKMIRNLGKSREFIKKINTL